MCDYKWVMAHICHDVSHGTHIRSLSSNRRHGICVPWLHATHMWHICAMTLWHMCAMAHICGICVPWSRMWRSHVTQNESWHTCDYKWVMAHICRICVPWLISSRTCERGINMSRAYQRVMSRMWRSHVTQMNESCHTYEFVLAHRRMSHVTHRNESCRIWTSQ